MLSPLHLAVKYLTSPFAGPPKRKAQIMDELEPIMASPTPPPPPPPMQGATHHTPSSAHHTPSAHHTHSVTTHPPNTGTTPAPSTRRRPISVVRRKREQALLLNTPSRYQRAWHVPATPREPNADSRLAKLSHYHEMKSHVKDLENDQEIKEMTAGHRTKRVKIDDLVYIPHNRPGEPSGTFRVYDEDSEDEMEVDEAVELRKNVFEEVTTKEPVKLLPKMKEHQENEQPAPPAPPPAAQPLPQRETGTTSVGIWAFPLVKEREEPYQEGTAHEARLGAIFKLGYDHFERSGELLPCF